MKTGTTTNDQSVLCPHCGEAHGDAWEWVKGASPQTETCEGCGEEFLCWAEHSVTYYACAKQKIDRTNASGGMTDA